jgi:hypothetical protein
MFLPAGSNAEFERAAARRLFSCARCDTWFIFRRSNKPHIDECGFESYRFECIACGFVQAGIVDPEDDRLL